MLAQVGGQRDDLQESEAISLLQGAADRLALEELG